MTDCEYVDCSLSIYSVKIIEDSRCKVYKSVIKKLRPYMTFKNISYFKIKLKQLKTCIANRIHTMNMNKYES